MRKKKLKIYEVAYASSMFSKHITDRINIYSDKKLKDGQFIVVERIGHGIFIAEVILEHADNKDVSDEDIRSMMAYRYVQDIDLSDFIDKKEKEQRKEELKKAMEERFKTIDKEQKFAYYATLDEDFKQLYNEYKDL